MQCKRSLIIPSDTFTVIPDFDIYYVYGFSSGNFVYFLTLQPEMVSPPGSTTKEQVYTSKLVRLCKEDTAFNSYVEVPIGCERNGVEYRLLQAAYLSKAGAVLGRTLGVRPDDDLLFTVFSKGQKRKMKSLDESALCIFILKQIDHPSLAIVSILIPLWPKTYTEWILPFKVGEVCL